MPLTLRANCGPTDMGKLLTVTVRSGRPSSLASSNLRKTAITGLLLNYQERCKEIKLEDKL